LAAGVLAELEASIDFPEEGISPAASVEIRGELVRVADACRQLERSFVSGRALTDGIVVALVGAVNAGKSSLLNALVGSERVLVADEPGTTRDYVEVRAVWDGVAVTIIDTAGERDDVGAVERRGIELGKQRAESADVIVRVIAPESSGHAGARDLLVASKVDLGWSPAAGALPTSAVTGEGIDELRGMILANVGLADDVEAGSAVVLTERQRAAAANAVAGFDAAVAALDGGMPVEVVALETRSGANALAAIEGDEVGEDVLDALFAKFCIGK
jgi:tRNA modification GTPase